MRRPILVLYHDNCPDGFTAAWSVYKALGVMVAEYRGVNYGQPPVTEDDVRDRQVFMVDFSYPRAVLDTIAKAAGNVMVLDHHKTAQADLDGWTNGRAIFDMERSGAGIAWDYFHRAPRPNIVAYVEDRDLWRWNLRGSREVSEYMFSVPRTFEAYDEAADYLESHLAGAIATGTVLLRVKRERVAAICKNVRWMRFGRENVAVPVVNAQSDMSELGEYLAERHGGIGGYYFDRADRRQWGFRSTAPGFDVSELCKQYGGGGHAAAAGFTSAVGWEPATVLEAAEASAA